MWWDETRISRFAGTEPWWMRVENFDPSVGDRIKMGDGIRARLLPRWRVKLPVEGCRDRILWGVKLKTLS